MTWTARRPLTGRMVLCMLLSFFGVIFTVNGFFVFFALTSWSGLSTEDSYNKGLAYNESLSAADAQSDRAWRVTTRFEAFDDKRGRLEVTFLDKNGVSIEGLNVRGTLIRPTQPDLDQNMRLHRIATGVYSADVELPLSGVWNLAVVARWNRDMKPGADPDEGPAVIYRIEQRLWLEPRK